MKTLKGIAANTAFILGALVLLPIGALSWLLERAVNALDALGYAISERLPEPRKVFSEGFNYWLWQVVAAGFFLSCMIWMLAMMAVGQPVAMLWYLALAMVWAVIVTRAWERRHAN